MFLHLKAKELAANKKIMDSYWAYQQNEQSWFFSPNPNLDSATKKPSLPAFNYWKKLSSTERIRIWDNLTLRQKMTISTLAGFGNEARGINLDNMNHFSKLKEAISYWDNDLELYSVFWGANEEGRRWLCNVFVGDAIYLTNERSFTSSNNHYYDPEQIYNGKSFLYEKENLKDVMEGDIVVFKRSHVEIITDVEEGNFIFDPSFCSIGAGRGDGRSDLGNERCDVIFSSKRELYNEDNKYFSLYSV